MSDDRAGEIPVSNRKVIALLAFLALGAGQAHSRETLMGLLWPELSETDARNNLRVTLARLRQQLAGATAVSPLVAGRNDIRWQAGESITLDTAAFQALLAQTEHHAHPGRAACSICREQLAAAAALYQGPLLHGLYLDDCPAFDEWLFVQRERFHLQALEVLEELAQGLEETGSYAEATAYTRRQLELDPLHDSAQRRLLRLLAYQGQPAAALSQFETIKKTLQSELGIEPDVELLHLAQQIKAGTLPLPGKAAPEPAAFPTNLPENLTPFIGRETELVQLGERLYAPGYRLVTLAGPGGIGKTRLALEAARANLSRFPDGVFFVPLAGVEQVEDIPAAIADALGFTFQPSAQSPRQQLNDHLASKKMLLVLDNLEHLVNGVEGLLALLRRCPGVTLLVTSRQRLDVQAEDLFPLGGLPMPGLDQIEQAGRFAAVRLFCDRAHRLQKSFKLTPDNSAAVAEICRVVGGLPLALELAAGWIRDFDLAELARAIRDNVDLLQTTMRDVSPQHRSIRAVFDHSWRLLAPAEKVLLANLSVFSGGFTTAAAAAAGATPIGLTRLRYQSLVREAGHGRYDLHEFTRQFAAEKLAEMGHEVETAVYRQHATYFTDLVRQQGEAIAGTQPQQAIRLIQQDLDNVRQAWRWETANGCWDALQTSVAGLSRFYHITGLHQEGEQMMGQALGVVPAGAEQPLHLDLLLEQTSFLINQARLDVALAQAETALALAQRLDDPARLGRAYLLLGRAYDQTGVSRQGCSYLEAGLAQARRGQNLALEGEILRYLGTTLQSLNERQQGGIYLQQALQIMRGLDNRTQEQAILLYLAVNHIDMNEYATGRPYLEAALQLIQATGNRPLESRIQNALGFVNAALGRFEDALPYHDRSRQISHEVGEPFQESHACHNLCTVNRKLGRLELAEQFGREALRLGQQYDLADPIAYGWLHLGYLFRDQGKFEAAVEAFAQARASWRLQEHSGLAIEATVGLAGALQRQGQAAQAFAEVETVLDFLAQSPLHGVDEPIEIYLACYRVLVAHQDGRAVGVLQQAREWIQQVADHIDDPETRATYLQNVPVNRELLSICERDNLDEYGAPPYWWIKN